MLRFLHLLALIYLFSCYSATTSYNSQNIGTRQKQLNHKKIHSFTGIGKELHSTTSFNEGEEANDKLTQSKSEVSIMSKNTQQDVSSSSFLSKLKIYQKSIVIFLSICGWFYISAVYNIYNKKALSLFGNMPWTVATIQMGTGRW